MGSKSKSKSKRKPKRIPESKKTASTGHIASGDNEDGNDDIGRVRESTLVHVTTDMLANMKVGDEMMRSIFLAAKEGSTTHLMMLPQLMRRVTATQVTEAITNLCAILDQPDFTSKRGSAPFSPRSREIGFFALFALSEIPEPLLASPVQSKVLRENWPTIFNAIRYFNREFFSPSISLEDPEDVLKLTRLIGGTVPVIVMIVVMDDAALKEMIVKDNTLLNILVRIWLTPNAVFIPHPSGVFRHRHKCYGALAAVLPFLEKKGGNLNLQMAKVVHEVLREVKWDTGKKIEMLVQYSRDPTKACEEPYPYALDSMLFLSCLINGRSFNDPDHITKFMEKVIKDSALPLVFGWFTFIAEDLGKYASRRLLSEEKCCIMMRGTCCLLRTILHSRNGMQWAVRFLDQGLLPALARIMPYTQWWSKECEEYLTMIFGDILPKYLGHRPVVVSSSKAVKDITVNGDIANLENSAMQNSWKTFIDVLLDRLVLHIACNREVAYVPCRKCVNCSKTEEDAVLFKCEGCQDALYCSKDCQTISWTNGHRGQCESFKDLKIRTGTRIPRDKFSSIIALRELRRHLRGLNKHLRSPKNPSGISLGDAFITVFLKEPPSLEVRSRRTLSKEHDYHTPSHKDDQGCVLEVLLYSGGRSNLYMGHVEHVPRNFQWLVPRENAAGDAEVGSRTSCRKPAEDDFGRSFAFVLDEIDHHVIDARAHFRSPEPGDEVSPKTIYDYVEEKVAADPNVLAWMGDYQIEKEKASDQICT